MSIVLHGLISGVLATGTVILAVENDLGFGLGVIGYSVVVSLCWLHAKHTGVFK